MQVLKDQGFISRGLPLRSILNPSPISLEPYAYSKIWAQRPWRTAWKVAAMMESAVPEANAGFLFLQGSRHPINTNLQSP